MRKFIKCRIQLHNFDDLFSLFCETSTMNSITAPFCNYEVLLFAEETTKLSF